MSFILSKNVNNSVSSFEFTLLPATNTVLVKANHTVGLNITATETLSVPKARILYTKLTKQAFTRSK